MKDSFQKVVNKLPIEIFMNYLHGCIQIMLSMKLNTYKNMIIQTYKYIVNEFSRCSLGR